MKPSPILLLATAALAATTRRGNAPCTNEACTLLCNSLDSCMSTLFDPGLEQCYTFPCVVNNYSRPSKFLGYQKPGATHPCPPEQPIPGEPESPPPPEPEDPPTPAPPPASEDTPPAEPEPEEPTPPDGEVPSPPATSAGVPTGPPDGGATPTAPGGPTESTDTNEPGGEEPSPTDEGADGPDPAAPTIVLDGAAPRALVSVSMMGFVLALWLL